MGSALMGSLRILLFDRGTCWYSRELDFPKEKCQGAPFSANLSKLLTFAAAPLVLTPFVRNQINADHCPKQEDIVLYKGNRGKLQRRFTNPPFWWPQGAVLADNDSNDTNDNDKNSNNSNNNNDSHK